VCVWIEVRLWIVTWNGGWCVQGVAGVSDNEADEKTCDDPHKLLDINLDEFVASIPLSLSDSLSSMLILINLVYEFIKFHKVR